MPDTLAFVDAFAVFNSGGLSPLISGGLPCASTASNVAGTGSECLPSAPFPCVASRLERSSVDVAPVAARRTLQTPFSNTGFINTDVSDGTAAIAGSEKIAPEYITTDFNQRVQCAVKTGCSVDWLSYTVHERAGDYRDVMASLTPDGAENDWFEVPGKFGYRQGFRRGALVLWYDGMPGMGCHVSLSGQGCRQVEDDFGGESVSETDWIKWLLDLRSCDGIHLTRLDVAKDDFDGVLDMAVIGEKVRSGAMVSRFRKYRRTLQESGELGELAQLPALPDAETWYFGERSSNMFVKIYNKQRERYDAGEPVSDTGHWVRVETTFKHEKLEQLLDIFAVIPTFTAVMAWVQEVVSFREPSDKENKSRDWDISPWWVAFWENVSKIKRSASTKAAKTLEQCTAWVNRQVAPLLSVVADVISARSKRLGLSPPRELRKWIVSLLENGRGRRRSKHKVLLADCLAAIRGENYIFQWAGGLSL